MTAPGSDRMSLQDIAQALDPRAHLTTYQTQPGGENRERHLLLPPRFPSYQHVAKCAMLAEDDRSFLYWRDMSTEPHSLSAGLGES